MSFNPRAVANGFLDLADESGNALNPMQIQKLVYFAHGWHLALADRALIDERIEAWPYGPVVPTLYHDFKAWGAGPIKKRATVLQLEADPKTERRTIIRFVAPALEDSAEVHEAQVRFAKDVLRRVWQVYGSFNALQLSQMTHEPGGPWDITRKANPGVRGADIDDELIKEHFIAKGLANEHRPAATRS